MKKADFSLSALKKASNSLTAGLAQKPKSDLERDGVIQRFEYTFELAWKSLRKYLELNGYSASYNVKDIFREAGRQGLLDSVEAWFAYLEARNLTSHTYDSDTAEKTYGVAKIFSTDVAELIRRLELKLG